MLIKVTAEMNDGRIATSVPYLPLDSLVYVGYVKEHHPELVGVPFDTPTDFDLPIERKNINNTWYYDCSFALAELVAEDERFYNKRYNEKEAEDYLQSKAKTVVTRKGKYKNFRNALNIYLVNKITWYVNGNMEEIKKCLNHVHFIGKKKSQGFGLIKSWTFEETKEELTFLRAIPDEDGNEMLGVRPPYFYDGNITRVTMPNDDRLACVRAFL
jgi:hypothetical protein|nr:MAG TPA: Cas system-associated RAMP superfamily protein [Caudoviricetes sp.]